MRKIFYLVFIVVFLNNLSAQEFTSKIDFNLKNKIFGFSDGQEILVWIYFTDKGKNVQRYFENPELVVSEKSLKRRAKSKAKVNLIEYSDIPINTMFIKQLKSHGIKIKHKSKWLNAVSCYATKTQIEKIQYLESVKQITQVKSYIGKKLPEPIELNFPKSELQPASITAHTYNYGSSLTQNELINVAAVHDLGFTGKNILICLMDAGFDRLTHEALAPINILATWDFVNNDEDVEDGSDLGEGSHGTSTLSLIGGFKEGKLIGTAFGADFILAKTENTESETTLEEDNWVAASEWADSIGADVFSTSLGYITFDTGNSYDYNDMDGNTTVITKAADLAVGKGIVVFNSAGNEGYNSSHNTLGAPADGDSVFAIGAVDANKNRVSFSSVGPTADGRIKPDFMAMGSGTYAAGNSSDTYYKSFSGTSAACPLAAGVAALLLEKDYNLTPIQIREILRNTSDRSSSPNNLYGWGVLNALAAIEQIPAVTLNLSVFLEGSYNSIEHIMNANLIGKIPLTSPYSENPRRVSSIPNNIIDWVLVELKETINGDAITSKSFLLRNDGKIVADDGINENLSLNAPQGLYYIVIKHRNHLPIMSSTALELNSTSSSIYDFTKN